MSPARIELAFNFQLPPFFIGKTVKIGTSSALFQNKNQNKSKEIQLCLLTVAASGKAQRE